MKKIRKKTKITGRTKRTRNQKRNEGKKLKNREHRKMSNGDWIEG